jgi:hypothetical protein
MNSTRSFSFKRCPTLAVLAVCITAGVAGAQHSPAMYEGKFTLPFETRWGRAVLPAGDYTLTVDSTALPATVTVHSVRENKTAPMIMAQAISQHGASDQSALIVARNSGKGVVRGLQLAELGLRFEYAMPRGTQLVAEAPQLFQRIGISAAGK